MKRTYKIFSILLVGTLLFAGCNTEKKPEAAQEKTRDVTENKPHKESDLAVNPVLEEKLKGIIKVDISYDMDSPYFVEPTPAHIEDSKMLRDIIQMLSQSKPLVDETKIKSMSGMASKDNKLLLTAKDGSKKEMSFAYDDPAFGYGYIILDGQKYEPDYSFFRYIRDLSEYKNPQTNIDAQVIKLFSDNNWTVDYRINSMKEKLPDTFKHMAGEYPFKVYWAYNNELSKDIGLDFSNFAGTTVDVEIYRLRESLPEFMKPKRNARGIMLKAEGRIVGAYIDAGRHDSFACSLRRRSLKEITGKDWDGWIAENIDYTDELENRLSSMEPEEIIKEYFSALDRHDAKMAIACLTRKSISHYLTVNIDSNVALKL